MILINTHTLAIDKRACSILAMIRSISVLFWSGVGAHVTVDGSVFAVVLSEESPVMLLWCDMIPESPLAAVVYLLEWSILDVAGVLDVIWLGLLDGLGRTDFSSNCNSSHLTVSNAACLRRRGGKFF